MSGDGSAQAPPDAPHPELSGPRGLRARDLAVRFAFGAGTSAVSAVVGLLFGARAGGIFLAFPAILGATITLISSEDGVRAAQEDARGSVLGAVALVAFAAVGAALFGHLPSGAVLALAALVWSLGTVGLYWLLWGRLAGS